MKYRYPKINNWLVFEKAGLDEYEVTDRLNDEKYMFGIGAAEFAVKLDGRTDPYAIQAGLPEKTVDEILRQLDELGLLSRSNVRKSGGTFYYALYSLKQREKRGRMPGILNGALQLLFLPTLLMGAASFFTLSPFLPDFNWILGTSAGLLIGMVFHEIAHATACLAYGGRVFELGLLFRPPLPGAYVLMDESAVRDPLKKAQIDAAGIESNLLIAGAAFLLASFTGLNAGFLFYVACGNVTLALINLLLIDGVDGSHILADLLGIPSLGDAALEYCIRALQRRKRRLSGRADPAYAVLYVSIALFTPLWLVLILANLGVIVSWFV